MSTETICGILASIIIGVPAYFMYSKYKKTSYKVVIKKTGIIKATGEAKVDVSNMKIGNIENEKKSGE